MKKTVTYKNYDGIIFDEKDRAKFKTYNVIHEENGNVKMIEEYDYHSIWSYKYYISDNERVEDILQKYYMHYIDIIEVKNWGEYKIEKSTIYDKNELYLSTKMLLNEFGDEIYEQEFEAIKGKLSFRYTKKFIYDDFNEKLYVISYNEDGSIKSISKCFKDEFSIRWREIKDEAEFNLYVNDISIKYPYCRNANFLPES